MSPAIQEKDAIRELMSEYCYLIDDGKIDVWLNLFTDDAVVIGPDGEQIPGRPAIKALFRDVDSDLLARTKHLTTNEIIRVDGDMATAKSTIIVYELTQSEPAISTKVVGIYEDKLVKLEGHWKFKERKFSIALSEAKL